MEHGKPGQMANSRNASENTSGIGDIDPSDTIIERASAAQYARRGKIKSDFRQVNRWIAISLYLILAGMALVIF